MVGTVTIPVKYSPPLHRPRPGPIFSNPVSQADLPFAHHSTTALLMDRHAIPEMRDAGRGSSVNTSTVSGREYFALFLEAADCAPTYHH